MPYSQELSASPRSYATATAALAGVGIWLAGSSTTYATASASLSGGRSNLEGAGRSYATASAKLSGNAVQLSASGLSRASASAKLSGGVSKLSASGLSYSLAGAALSGGNVALSGSGRSYAQASASLTGTKAELSADARTYCVATATLSGASDSHGLSICDVVSDILNMWGIFCRKSAPDFAIDAAINIANQSLQLVWNNAKGRNYWTNVPVTITLSDGESSQDLGDDIQNVVGPCRLADTKQPLVPIGTIGELETFSDIYLDGEGADSPMAYHVERMNQSGGDPAKCVFHVNSVIDGDDVSFLLEVVKEAPRFIVNDLSTCPVVPIPHRYVESLLLPVARYQASSFYLFRMADQKPTIDREYQQAMISLGLADPINPQTGDNKERGGSEA